MSTPTAAATAKLTRKVLIFNPVDPLVLKNGSKASIIAFDKAYKEYGKKRVEYGKTLSLSFTSLSFKGCIECKSLLISSCTLAHPKANYALCVFTDASLDFWGSIVTQIPYSELDLPFYEQTHEALAFLNSAFKGAFKGAYHHLDGPSLRRRPSR